MQLSARKAAAPIFTAAMFASAALIFALQPLFGRLVTPLLGGSPAVWNTSMAFFQGALLVGYLYAHLLQRLRDLKVQAAIHVALLLAASLALPIHVSQTLGAPTSDHPALWLLGVLTLSVGAPFAIASATAPLLQSWYARSGRPDAHDPYYLYAASNLGSFVGLLAYPILIEPLLDTRVQGQAWGVFYLFVAALIVLAGATAITTQELEISENAKRRSREPDWRQRLLWIAAAAIPSALTLGVTLHISTDVASAPMLWVIPLALYLATFVIAFSRDGEKWTPFVLAIHPPALALLVAAYFWSGNWAAALSGNLVGFTISALICHLALARARPAADRLTEFYFFVSLGGVLGGAFAALAAPVLFNNVYEYPLALAAAALFRPRQWTSLTRIANAIVAASFAMASMAVLLMFIEPRHAVLAAGAIGAAAALIGAGWRVEQTRIDAHRIGLLGAGAAFALIMLLAAMNGQTLFREVALHGAQHLVMNPPWNILVITAGLMLLAFTIHATLQRRDGDLRVEDATFGIAGAAALLSIGLALMGDRLDARAIIVTGLAISALGLLINHARPIMLAVLIASAFTMIFLDNRRGGDIITQERSFFGVLRTEEINLGLRASAESEPISLRILMHGTTIHGAQLHGRGVSRLPLTYYNPHTALGEATLAGLSTEPHSSLALIGMGAGATSCLTRPQDQLTIYEIDPAVVRLSGPQGRDFSYIRECQPHARIVLGDARLGIATAPDHSFDVIVVDAFSSDAIPAHLLTQEALALYLSKTTDRGIVVLHLSNRNLALVSEAARVATALHAPYLWRLSQRVSVPMAGGLGGLPASVMIVARSPQTLASLPIVHSEWRAIPAPPGRAWSDAYINLPRALWENLTGQEECRTYPDTPRCAAQNN